MSSSTRANPAFSGRSLRKLRREAEEARLRKPSNDEGEPVSFEMKLNDFA